HVEQRCERKTTATATATSANEEAGRAGQPAARRTRDPNTHTSYKSAPIQRFSDISSLHSHIRPADLEDYLDVCASGEFYEALADVLGRPCVTEKDRKRVKGQACWLIMGEPPAKAPQWLRFSSRWPTVAAYLVWLKQGDHRRAAHQL